MSGDSKILHPSVMWAQRADKIYLTINVEDCENPKIELNDKKLFFKGKGGAEKKEYEVEIEFLNEINPDESKHAILARNIPFCLKKKEDKGYWPKLIKGNKVHWLKTDFEKWRDEDDSDIDESNDMAFEDMMKQMGNFNTSEQQVAQEPEEEEEDSDDEELPDLQ